MKVFISAVGTTDPISNNRDAAVLHIARTYRPEQIVLVYSEEMLIKRDLIEKALCSIEGYHPKVVIESIILNLKSLLRDTSDYFCFICLKSN